MGLDPNGWLIQDGIKREVRNNLVKTTRPQFTVNEIGLGSLEIDYIVGQSICSHSFRSLVVKWLKVVAENLKSTGACLPHMFQEY